MAVTLTATATLLPGRPALAFGSTGLALILGAWPVCQAGDSGVFGERWVVFALIIVSAVALYVSLRMAFSRIPKAFAGVYESVSAV